MIGPKPLTISWMFVCLALAAAQEPVTPTATPTPDISPYVSPSPSPALNRTVRIRFVPPPLDGTISLGIFDTDGKLVRVLHQQAPLDAFTIGADSLETKWDGKDDDGQDLPPGKYHGRGYAVGPLQITALSDDAWPSASQTPDERIGIKLTSNPLVKNDRPSVQLAVGFDDTDSFLKTADELPLYVISERPDVSAITATKSGEKSIDVWQESGAGSEHLRISKLDQIMAFDCGVLDLK
jgi:hypothetical protein